MPARELSVGDIFTPNDTPTVTYVDRVDLQLESKLREYCSLPKMVVSISGPSKSGKTVLINKVLHHDTVIPVIGSGITSPDDLWARALQWMETPASVTTTVASGSSFSGNTRVGGEAGLPLIASGSVEAVLEASRDSSNSVSKTIQHDGLPKVIKEIAHSDFVIFLDDFHYINESHRDEIGRQIKVAADNGVKIITASVPHRTDDVVRSNPELRGRVAAVDVGYWDARHLRMVARQGFSALNVDLSPRVENKICSEAMGSPQLMQTICFCLCQVLNIREPRDSHTRIEITDQNIADALLQTSHFTDFTKMLTALHAGPRTRGQERKEHQLIDGSSGDVYRAVLLAMCSDPVGTTFPYDNMMSRIRTVCKGDSPVGSSVTSCLEQMQMISENLQPGDPVLVWDGDNLDVTDPYFAFFLRSSEKLMKLGST